MINIDDVIAGAKLPERTLPLCLRGDLQAEWEDLQRQLTVEQENTADEALAGNAKVLDIANRMEAIGQEMASCEVVFRFRALSTVDYSDLLAANRLPEDKREDAVEGLDWDTYPTALIAASAIDPVMSVKKVEALSRVVTNRQWDDLFQTALAVNRSAVSVPFSLAASAIRAATAPNSKRPEPGASPAAGSSDESLAG